MIMTGEIKSLDVFLLIEMLYEIFTLVNAYICMIGFMVYS